MRESGQLVIGKRGGCFLGRGLPVTKAVTIRTEFLSYETIARNLTSIASKLSGIKSPDVIVSDELVRYFMVTPPTAIRNLAELQAIARFRFEELFSQKASEWTFSASWQAARPFICCALPTALIDGIHQEWPKARSLRPVLSSLMRSLEKIFDDRYAAPCWITYATSDWVTAACFQNYGQCSVVRSLAHGNSFDHHAWMTQESIFCGYPTDDPVFIASEISDAPIATNSRSPQQRTLASPLLNQLDALSRVEVVQQ